MIKLSRTLASLADRYLQWYKCFSYDPKKNGEAALIRNVRNLGLRTVFDVGANVGGWSELLLQEIPDAKANCFEISATAYDVLCRKMGGKAICYNLGLSNESAQIRYKDYGPSSTVNTISMASTFWDHAREHALLPANVVRGDEFCEKNNLSCLDFLKVDVEGAESLVLEGFSRMLSAKKIRLIQFEYGYANGDQHYLMKDFYKFFSKFGYIIGPVRPWGIEFCEFSYALNNFLSGPNYVAIRSDDGEMLNAIGAKEGYGR